MAIIELTDAEINVAKWKIIIDLMWGQMLNEKEF